MKKARPNETESENADDFFLRFWYIIITVAAYLAQPTNAVFIYLFHDPQKPDGEKNWAERHDAFFLCLAKDQKPERTTIA